MSRTGEDPADLRNPNHNRFAKARDQQTFEFLETHAATARQIVREGLHTSEAKVRERMKIAERRGQVRYVAHVLDNNGSWVKLWSKWPFPKQNAQHEYEITEIIQARGIKNVRRGFMVDEMFADTEGTIGNEWFYLEHDRGTEDYSIIKKKLERLQGNDRSVLFVFPTQTRIDGVFRKYKDLIQPHHWFTTYERAISDGDDVWSNPTDDPTDDTTDPPPA